MTVNGAIVGQSSYVLPSQSGSNGKFLSNDGTKLQWKDLSVESGIRSMSVYTGGNTWNKPNGVGTIHVLVTGAGGGGSGFGESGGAGGHSEKVINVQNINSVGITVGSPGGGAYYNGCGGNGNASSFGSYLSANGGVGGNCSQQHAGGLGGHGSGGELNIHGGGGSGHGSYHSYGRHYPGPSFWGGGQLVVITEIITMHTLMNRMLHGALAVVVLSLVIEVPEVVRVLLLYTSITAINQ